jgi:hypothetical protein
MKRSFSKTLTVTVAIGALGLGACTDIAYYTGFEELRIDGDTPESEHPNFAYWVQTEYYLDYAPPVTSADFDSMGDPEAEPSGRNPWIKADDIDLTLEWALTNDSDENTKAWVMLDGATEFFDWNPVGLYGLAGGEDAEEIAFPTALGFTPFDIAPGETIRGEFREDDIREAMYDIDVLTRFCGGPFALLHNRHEVNPVGTDYVPEDAVIAGFYMTRLTLGMNAPGHLEYGIRVRDREQVLYDANSPDYDVRFEAEPEEYVPGGFAAPMMGMPDPTTMSEYCLEVNPPDDDYP